MQTQKQLKSKVARMIKQEWLSKSCIPKKLSVTHDNQHHNMATDMHRLSSLLPRLPSPSYIDILRMVLVPSPNKKRTTMSSSLSRHSIIREKKEYRHKS